MIICKRPVPPDDNLQSRKGRGTCIFETLNNEIKHIFCTESVRKHKKLNFKSLCKWNWVTGSFIPTFILAPGDSEDGSTVVVVCSWSWVRKSCCSSWFKVKSWEVSTKKRVTGQPGYVHINLNLPTNNYKSYNNKRYQTNIKEKLQIYQQ